MNTHKRTPALQRAIDRTSNLPKDQLAPTQYRAYTPTFQADRRLNVASPSARATRFVAEGILHTRDLVASDMLSQRDSDIDEVKELMLEHLGVDSIEGFGIEDEPENLDLDIDLELW